MKYLSIPVQLVKFWYPESLVVFLRIWRNSLLYLEEDLAVGLMFRLLFVPLFHDSSISGRILSFFFRLSRVLIGGAAFFFVSLFLLIIALGWFTLPFLAVIWMGNPGFLAKVLFFCGAVLFIRHILAHPPKKLWQIKNQADLLQCSFVKNNDLLWHKLLQAYEVKNLLLYLEQTPQTFLNFNPDFNEEDLFKTVWGLGRKFSVRYLEPQHFFVAQLSLVSGVDQALLKLGLKLEDFYDALDFLQKKTNWWRMIFIWDEDFKVRHLKGVNRGWLSVPTPNLDSISEDITKRAAREYIPDFIGRQDVVSRVVNILSLEKERNVLLVGDPGSGRGALIAYLAKQIVSGDAPDSLATKRLIKLDTTRILAGIHNQGELAERIKAVFEEAEYCGNIIVYIDEIQNLGIGEAASQFNLYSLLLPYIESASFQFVATTDSASFTRILGKNASFARLFAKIELPPATISETVNILKNRALEIEKEKRIKTSLLAVKEIAQLSAEYVHDLVLPDGALKVFDECLAMAGKGWVKRAMVEGVVQKRTAIPVGEVSVEIKKQLLDLESLIHQKMIGQEEAVAAVASVLRRSAAGLREKSRPIGSFLFVGPTGVGKTELAKTLVEVYFQGKGNFLRLDMSEYQSSESVNRLIGSLGEEGILTEAVHLHSYSLILLDEFEKADPKILTLFLQVLDDGRLTSGSGRTVDFTNTIIIATSNAASLTIAQGLQQGRSLKDVERQVKAELLQIFRPELVNRFDEVVLFKPLSPQDLQKVVSLKLKALQNQLQEQGYLVDFAPELIQQVAQKGFDPVLGARPLRRLIQDTLEAKLSTMILEDKLPKGEKFIASDLLLT